MSKEYISDQSVSEMLRKLQSQDRDKLQREIENKQKQYQESQKVMSELGVTPIMEEIRKKGEVVYYRHEKYTRTEFPFGFVRMRYYTEKVDPAIIQYGDQTTSITLLFGAQKELNDDAYTYSYIKPNSVYVEKRGDDLFVGGTRFERFDIKETKVIETKVESMDQLPELIAKTIHTVSPYLQLTTTPESVKWHR